MKSLDNLIIFHNKLVSPYLDKKLKIYEQNKTLTGVQKEFSRCQESLIKSHYEGQYVIITDPKIQ